MDTTVSIPIGVIFFYRDSLAIWGPWDSLEMGTIVPVGDTGLRFSESPIGDSGLEPIGSTMAAVSASGESSRA